jgi:hypothetical protein
MGGLAFFMISTALIVLFPVVLQLREGESRLSQVWGYFLFIAGLLLIAAGDIDFARSHQALLTVSGIAVTLVGLIGQARQSERLPPDQPS